jgi:hypothetical protein
LDGSIVGNKYPDHSLYDAEEMNASPMAC